jgi:hypothetical protein
MNANILDRQFSEAFENLLLEIIESDCREVTFKEYIQRKTLFFQITDWVSYQMIRAMMRIMFLLTSKRK